MNTAIQHTIKHWNYVAPYTHVPCNETEYEELVSFVEELMKISRQKKDERVTSLLKLISKNIEEYETHRYPAKPLAPHDMLKFLMQEHNLGQADLPEIGSQSLVSKILSGERQLTLDHVRSLAQRFAVSPAVFC